MWGGLAMRRAFAGCSAAAAAIHGHRRRLPCTCEDAEAGWHPGYRWFPPGHLDAGSAAAAGKLRGPRWPGPSSRPGERLLTRAEVSARDGSGEGGEIWVTYRDGVYDVTRYFAEEHPGGKFLLQAAGGSVEGFWAHWSQHHISPEVPKALERLRIGRLVDYEPEDDEAERGDGAWADEQVDVCRQGNRRLAFSLSEMPYQSETLSAEMARSYLTPNSAFYVRNHAPVPHVPPDEADSHIITFSMDDEEVASLSLEELNRRFTSASVVSVMQCAGNRAGDDIAMNGARNSGFVGGDSENLGLGMLGNARWRGPRLAEVLRALLPPQAGLDTSDLHVTFEGLDGYYTSTPLSRILDDSNDCLLATEMNGVPLPIDHGFPVRALLPGVAGTRNVKWLSRINIGKQTDSPWIQKYYRDRVYHSESLEPSLEPIQLLPMNSVILSPQPGALVVPEAKAVVVRGVAFGGGSGNAISSVEVSADRGQKWLAADILRGEVVPDDAAETWGWVRFEAKVPLPDPGSGYACGNPQTEIWCRARDSKGVEQPEVSAPRGGYLFSGYHRVPVVRGPAPPPAEVVL